MATAVITAVIVAIVQHIPAINPSPPPPPQSTGSADPAAPPTNLRPGGLVRVDSVVVAHSLSGYVFKTPYQPSAADLGALNAILSKSSMSDSWISDYDNWFLSRGAVDAGVSHIQLVLQGNSTQQVRIVGIRIHKQCSAPFTGTYFHSEPAGGDGSIHLTYNLDDADPVPTYLGSDLKEHPYFDDHTVSLQSDEQVVLQLEVTTEQHYCTFAPILQLVDVGGSSQQTIESPSGKPFEVAAHLGVRFTHLYDRGVYEHFDEVDPGTQFS